jgi:hypothetical protein
MTGSTLHDHAPTPVVFPRHRRTVQSAGSCAGLPHGSEAAVHAGDRPVASEAATSPGTWACPAAVTGGTPASQHEFYHYFGLALLALIAISLVVAARG